MTPLSRGTRIAHHSSDSSPLRSLPDTRGETILPNGWRVVGRPAAEIFTSLPREALAYSSRFLVRPRLGSDAVAPVLDVLSNALALAFPATVRLQRDSAAEVRVDDASNFQWRTVTAGDRWIGELTWRAPMTRCPGFSATTRLAFSELPGRLCLHVLTSVPEKSITAKRVASRPPDALALLAPVARLVVDGRPVGAEVLLSAGIQRFVRDELIGSTRHRPILVMSPREDGSYPVSPEVLAQEFAGLAHVRVLGDCAASYALSDALGTRRLGCYLGALRLYWANFELDTPEERSPLLLVDTAAEQFERDNLAHLCARRAVQAEAAYEDFESQAAVLLPPPKRQGRTPSEAPSAADPASRVNHEDPEHAAPAARSRGGKRPSIRSARTPRTVDDVSSAQVPAASAHDEVLRILLATVGDLGQLTAQLRADLTAAQTQIVSLRTQLAATSGPLERVAQIDATLRACQLFPDLALPVPTSYTSAAGADAGAHAADTGLDAGRAGVSAPALSPLVAVVRAARDSHPECLVVTAAAERAAADSPYDAPDRVAEALAAMAEVARRKSLGALRGGIRSAFRSLGFEYQSGIPKGTSKRMRQQYEAYCPDGRRVLCSEHLSLGTSYDPARCLRIYFACRGVPGGQIIVGHVGRHFDVKSTS